MGKWTGARRQGSGPKTRKKQRSLYAILWRSAFYSVLVGAVLFVVTGFYYSGQIRDSTLLPSRSYEVQYDLEITRVSGVRVSITDTGSDGQIGQPGIEGIAWENGYFQTSRLVSSTEAGNGDRTDVRVVEEGASVPPVGTAVRLDAYAFAGDPEQAFGISFETVRYTSNIDSFPAWYIEGGSPTWAIIVHGKGADLTESLRIIPILHALDYPILVIHYRNDPGDTKDPSGYYRFGTTEWVDLAAAVVYAEDNGSQNHLLVGYSMGGAIVTSYLTKSPLRNRTRGAILDSPTLSLEAAVDFQAGNTNLPLVGINLPKPLTSFAKWIAGWRFDVNWDETNYLAQSNELHAPMLIFHGTNDESVPLATSQQLANLRPDIVTLVTTEASHVRSWNESPGNYKSAIIEFLLANPG